MSAAAATVAIMRSAVDLPAFHDFADLDLLTRAAVEAERAGWDRFSLWDHVNWPVDAPVPTADAWLAAAVKLRRLSEVETSAFSSLANCPCS